MLWRIERHESVTSTQDVVKDMAALGEPEGLAVLAATQSGGRGRHGRIWESPPGNLHLSVLLRPACTASQLGQLSLVIAVALYRAIERHITNDTPVTLKWPNDAMIGGRKCAGILLEAHSSLDGMVEWVVAGIGVDIVYAPLENTTFLNEHTEIPVGRDRFCEAVLAEIGHLYARWGADGFEPIRMEWIKRGPVPGAPVTIRNADGTFRSGFFSGIDGDGALLIEEESGSVRKITAGDVLF